MNGGQHDVADDGPVDSSSNFVARSRSEKFQIGLPPVKNILPRGTC
jgi:hypothetical protein